MTKVPTALSFVAIMILCAGFLLTGRSLGQLPAGLVAGPPSVQAMPLSEVGQKLLKGYKARYELINLETKDLLQDVQSLQDSELKDKKLNAADGWFLNFQTGQIEKRFVPPPPPTKKEPGKPQPPASTPSAEKKPAEIPPKKN